MNEADQDNSQNSPAAGITALLFRVTGSRYVVDVHCVQQILWLPELVLIEEAPPFHAGVFNLRGRVVHVVDLERRFGHPSHTCAASDCVVVLETGAGPVGVMASEVLDVLDVVPLPGRLPAAGPQAPPLLAGQAQTGDGIVMMIDPHELLPATVAEAPEGTASSVFCPDLGDADRELLQDRARNYRQEEQDDRAAERTGMAVVTLGGEFFGVDLAAVREFAEVGDVAPVPCCPPHVVGNMNLRGDIVTLLDIRGVLGMSMTGAHDNGKLIVAEHESLLVGVPVQDILDVLFVEPGGFRPTPAAVGGNGTDYVRGEVPYESRMATVLDLPRILAQGNLRVAEKI